MSGAKCLDKANLICPFQCPLHINPHLWKLSNAFNTRQTRQLSPGGKMGIMLRSSGAKYNSYQLTCESTVIQPGNVERLFVGGELHVLAWSEEPTVAASSGSFVPMLAVSDNLQNYIQEGPPLLLLDILAVHALARGDQQKEDSQQYVPFPLHLHGFTVWEHKQMFVTLEKNKQLPSLTYTPRL